MTGRHKMYALVYFERRPREHVLHLIYLGRVYCKEAMQWEQGFIHGGST